MKILIIKPSSLGDIVHGLQVANEIKCSFKDVEIDWVVRDCFADIVRLSDIADNIFLFHRHGGFKKFITLIREIRAKRYDYVLDMQGLARSGIMTFFAHATHKIGRKDAREGSRLCYNFTVSLPDKERPHAIDILLEFLKCFNLEPVISHSLNFDVQKCKVSSEVGLIAQKHPICIFPDSRRSEKKWPYFEQFIEKFSKLHENETICVLGQDFIFKQFNSLKSSKNVLNLINKTSIADMIVLIQNSKFIVANDSAPIHVASAVNVPVVALFGPTDFRKYGPYSTDINKNVIVQSDNKTMGNICINNVMIAAEKLFRQSDNSNYSQINA